MSAKRKFFISYLLIFLICGAAFGSIHFVFKKFVSSEPNGALSESLLSGLFFGIIMVAILLITKPKRQ